jgi:two-component system, OmpR family, KDP operon response regulator KdpE
VLARNPGRVLTHHWLLSRVWGTTDLAKTETLRVHINQLRRKLGEGPRRPKVLAEPGVGYRLIEPDRHEPT